MMSSPAVSCLLLLRIKELGARGASSLRQLLHLLPSGYVNDFPSPPLLLSPTFPSFVVRRSALRPLSNTNTKKVANH